MRVLTFLIMIIVIYKILMSGLLWNLKLGSAEFFKIYPTDPTKLNSLLIFKIQNFILYKLNFNSFIFFVNTFSMLE